MLSKSDKLTIALCKSFVIIVLENGNNDAFYRFN